MLKFELWLPQASLECSKLTLTHKIMTKKHRYINTRTHKHMKQISLLVFIILLLTNCTTKEKKEIDVSAIEANITIQRLETELSSFDTLPEVVAFLEKHSLFANEFLGIKQYPSINILTETMLRMGQDYAIDTLTKDAVNAFPSLDKLENELTQGYKHLKYYYPEQPIPTSYSCVTGFGTDVMVNDSILVIGLDFFMAGKSRFIPEDIPGYILKYYSEEYIPTKVMALVSQKYNAFDIKDQTILSQMIHYGKSHYFIESMYPSAADSIVIEYSAKEIDDLSVMAPKVWAHFVENKLFFNTSRESIRRYIDDRPNTVEIGDKCPGRIGRWLGWQIVRSYMERNPEITLQELMEEKDAAKIFKEAKYKPL